MSIVGPLFGVTRKFVKLNVGHHIKLDNSKSKAVLGINYTPIKKSIIDMVEWMK
jgi:nucleoside-diphosphate-sugar epimerase